MEHTDTYEKKPLPQLFLSRMEKELGDEFPLFLSSYDREPLHGLRVNTLKLKKEALAALLPFELSPIPDADDAFLFPQDKRPGLSPYHEAGLYYLQEPSAMTVSAAVAAAPGERVLDLCAAPGGKATAIAARMEGRGLLIANEIIPKRAAILSQNIERMGVRNCVVTNHSPAELSAVFPAFFDRILVDAPCSGEGMFKKEPQAIDCWSPENISLCAERQAEILEEADLMLRPGGRLVYSTCTFAGAEDEEQVAHFLELHTDYELIFQKKYLPHLFPGEGQYVAVLEKSGEHLPSDAKYRPASPDRSVKELLRAWIGFLSEFPLPELPGVFTAFGDRLCLLPEPLRLSGLKILRPGLHLGTVTRDRFEPSHSLALALRAADVPSVFDIDEKTACDYINGLSLPCGTENGWCLVTVDGHSLGFGKVSGGQCKNHYPKGLRRKTVALNG